MLLRQVRWFGANGRRALDALRATSALDWQFSRARPRRPARQQGEHARSCGSTRPQHNTGAPARRGRPAHKHSTRAHSRRAAQTARTQKGSREAAGQLAELLEGAGTAQGAQTEEGISRDGKRARTADKRRRRDVKSNRGRYYFSTSGNHISPTSEQSKELAALPEVVAADTLRQQLRARRCRLNSSCPAAHDADKTTRVDAGL